MTKRILLVQTIDELMPPGFLSEALFEVRRIKDLSEILRSGREFRPSVVAFEIRRWQERMEDLFCQLSSLRSTQSARKLVLVHNVAATDVVNALEMGAGDFIIKPVSSRELLARLNALLRSCGSGDADEGLSLGALTLHRKEMEVSVGERRTKLSQTELNLLAYFLEKPGCVISRDELLENVWSPDRMVEQGQIVDVYIYRLRAIIEVQPNLPRMLLTRQGGGYSLVDPERG